jgi:Zn/Cd-binding protein ZinT
VLYILQYFGVENPFELLVYTSPIMIMITAYLYYGFGRTIEIIETTKTVVNFAKENKHHAKPTYDKFKQLIKNKGK